MHKIVPALVSLVLISGAGACGAAGPAPAAAPVNTPPAVSATPVVIDEMPDEEPIATATPARVGSPVTVKGKGNKNTKKFELYGDYEVKVTYSGNSSQYGPTNFIMSVEAVGGAQPVDGSIANVIKSKGRIDTNIYGFAGEYYLDVDAEGVWQAEFTPQ
ncbi:hypothetical protein ACBI99_38055 [Nonomuraea sp. ATR24]|uniref:hypothetical protein n=1 Tax=Nonomuraea sp. ATR24 TaxID=1676744 RepID=UPI0035C11295